jgi:hypothetical protein
MALFEVLQTGRFLHSARGLLRAIAAGRTGSGDSDGDVPVQRPADPAETGRTQR